MRQAKQKPQLFGMLKFGRLVSGENGLFTVVYPKAMGAAYVKMLSIPEKNEEVAEKRAAVSALHEQIEKAKEELEAKQKEVKKKLERIAVLQARTNNVLNQRVGGGLTRPAAIMSEGDEVGVRRGREA